MRQAARTARYDQALGLEAYSLRAVDRPFPSHFHDHYVIGVVERGTRTLTCGRQRQVIGPGDVLLFNPGDSHACIQADGALDYRGLNIPRSTMLARRRPASSPSRTTATEKPGIARLPMISSARASMVLRGIFSPR